MRAIAVASFFTVVSGCLPFAATAGDEKDWRADAGRGEQLAETLCSGCHVVSSGQTSSAVAGVPTFRAIANLPGRSNEHIGNTLIRPHPPMPNVQLTQHEIADLLAYFGTLRKTDGDAPNKRDGGASRPKPVYPSPS